jgi:hypothetical protein
VFYFLGIFFNKTRHKGMNKYFREIAYEINGTGPVLKHGFTPPKKVCAKTFKKILCRKIRFEKKQTFKAIQAELCPPVTQTYY